MPLPPQDGRPWLVCMVNTVYFFTCSDADTIPPVQSISGASRNKVSEVMTNAECKTNGGLGWGLGPVGSKGITPDREVKVLLRWLHFLFTCTFLTKWMDSFRTISTKYISTPITDKLFPVSHKNERQGKLLQFYWTHYSKSRCHI